jgi:hypothetical protein
MAAECRVQVDRSARIGGAALFGRPHRAEASHRGQGQTIFQQRSRSVFVLDQHFDSVGRPLIELARRRPTVGGETEPAFWYAVGVSINPSARNISLCGGRQLAHLRFQPIEIDRLDEELERAKLAGTAAALPVAMEEVVEGVK